MRIDLYTHNYAYVGTLTSGNGAGRFLLAGPDWAGTTPEDVKDVIRSETSLVFVVVRTQLLGNDDLPRVAELQQSYSVQPLSAVFDEPAPADPPLPELPDWVEGAQFDARSLEYLDVMLQLLPAPTGAQVELRQRMASIGLSGDGTFSLDGLSDSTREALAAGVKDGVAEIDFWHPGLSGR